MHQVLSEYYNNGNGWRVAVQDGAARRVLTVEQAVSLRDKIGWAVDQIALRRKDQPKENTMKEQLEKLIESWETMAKKHESAIERRSDPSYQNLHRSHFLSLSQCAKALKAIVNQENEPTPQGPQGGQCRDCRPIRASR